MSINIIKKMYVHDRLIWFEVTNIIFYLRALFYKEKHYKLNKLFSDINSFKFVIIMKNCIAHNNNNYHKLFV